MALTRRFTLFSKYHLTSKANLASSPAPVQTEAVQAKRRSCTRPGLTVLTALTAWVLPLGSGGCDAFDPAFVALIDPSGTSGLTTLDNASGHVIIAVVNNAGIDERLLNFLAGSSQTLTADQQAELASFRPRIRMRVRVNFTPPDAANPVFQTIEYVTGTGFVQSGFEGLADPDLNQNDLNNTVVLCDVHSITLEPNSAIEVFIPVQLTSFEFVEVTNAVGVVSLIPQPRDQIPPGFQVLRVDDVDTDGNVTLRRNIGNRDVPSPVPNVLCGSVVVFEITGELSVPFIDASPSPAFDRDAERVVATLGGRYEFRVSVQ